MKRMKMIAMLLALALCLQTPVCTVNVQAATVKSGLVKKSGKYYFYSKGAKLKNRWKSTKSGKYYFGKNGAAYAGKKLYGEEVFAIKKIKGKQYGFGANAKMLKGTHVGYTEANGYQFYVFSSKGVYSKTKSKKLNKAAEYGDKWSKLKKLLGKPSKAKEVDNCFGDGGQDFIYYYKNFTVSTHRAPSGSEVVFGINPR